MDLTREQLNAFAAFGSNFTEDPPDGLFADLWLGETTKIYGYRGAYVLQGFDLVLLAEPLQPCYSVERHQLIRQWHKKLATLDGSFEPYWKDNHQVIEITTQVGQVWYLKFSDGAVWAGQRIRVERTPRWVKGEPTNADDLMALRRKEGIRGF